MAYDNQHLGSWLSLEIPIDVHLKTSLGLISGPIRKKKFHLWKGTKFHDTYHTRIYKNIYQVQRTSYVKNSSNVAHLGFLDI